VKQLVVIVFYCLYGSLSFGQYYEDPDLNEGFYLSLDQLQQNAPFLTDCIIHPAKEIEPDYFQQVLSNDTLYAQCTPSDTLSKFGRNELLGVCIEGVLYLQAYEEFYRVLNFGTLTYFITTNPLSGAQMPRSRIAMNSWGVGMSVGEPTVDVAREFILDTRSGEAAEFLWQNLATAIASDQELYNRYMSLKKRERKRLVHVYLRAFNDRNPIYP